MARPQEFDHQATIDAALAVFWDKGLHRTSVDDLLAASGLAKSSLYNAYGGKQALFEAAVGRYVELQAEGLEKVLAAASLEAALKKLFQSVVQDNFEGRGCLLVNCAGSATQREDDEQPILRNAFNRMFSVVEARLRRAQQDGEISDAIEAPAAAMLVCATMSGLRIFHKAGLPKARLRKATDLAVSTLVQQLA
jgi:AcrR family transcriptional regulator